MKKYFLLIFSLFSSIILGQDKEVIQFLENFNTVKGFDGLSINLIRSSENKAVISGVNTNSVAIVNNDGVLKIRMKLGKIFSGYETYVDLFYTADLVVIDVNEDARIASKNVINQNILELKAQEGGELDINAEVEQMLIKSVTGGIIKVSGHCEVQDVQINTGGVYKGKAFLTKFSTINVNAGSRAEIYANDYVKATVKAGGEVIIYGNPKQLEDKTVFGGSIKRM